MNVVFYTAEGKEVRFNDVTVRAENDNLIVFTQPFGSPLAAVPQYSQTSIVKTAYAGCTIEGLNVVPIAESPNAPIV